MSERRQYLGAFTDAILGYWLNGTEDPDLLEWWSTTEAVDATTEMFGAFIDICEDRGLPLPWAVTPTPELPDRCPTCGSRDPDITQGPECLFDGVFNPWHGEGADR